MKLFSRHMINNLSRFKVKVQSPSRYASIFTASSSPLLSQLPVFHHSPLQIPDYTKPIISFHHRFLHSTQETIFNESEEDPYMNEFLSRFVWIMRRKLSEAYTNCEKQTIDGMLLVIVGKVVSEIEKGGLEQMLGESLATVSQDFSEDLWKTVWEVSNSVVNDMNKERRKEKLKRFMQDEEVKEMCRFAGEVGVRGDMLRELRFKWAQEKMEDSEFKESLKRIHEECEKGNKEAVDEGEILSGETSKVVSLPQRKGKIKYKIYGLDLSGPKWSEVADRVQEVGEGIWPQEPKPISGKCKLITERILSLNLEDDPSPLLAEWVELLQPNRIDWIGLLDRLKDQNMAIYFKIAELILSEESFQTNIRDYSRLIDAHAKENRLEDAERILKKMNENGVAPDILTSTVLVHMYSKSGNLNRATEAFEMLRTQGFQPDPKIFTSMIMAHVNAGDPKKGESLMREMEARDIKPTEEIYMALLRSFARLGDVGGASRISITMQFSGFQPNLESCALLIETYGRAGNPDQARVTFDQMMKIGQQPDDRCTASMIAAYEKKNLLDKALNLLLQLKKVGFEPGIETYTVLVDWLAKLQLVDEAEQILGKIGEAGEVPSIRLHCSLCDMYARAGLEKKALQALGLLERKKEELGQEEFEKVINGLIAGGFVEDARRVEKLMEGRGFSAPENLKVALMASQAFDQKRPTIR